MPYNADCKSIAYYRCIANRSVIPGTHTRRICSGPHGAVDVWQFEMESQAGNGNDHDCPGSSPQQLLIAKQRKGVLKPALARFPRVLSRCCQACCGILEGSCGGIANSVLASNESSCSCCCRGHIDPATLFVLRTLQSRSSGAARPVLVSTKSSCSCCCRDRSQCTTLPCWLTLQATFTAGAA